MKILPILAICSLLLLAACVKPSESNQSIQDIVSETPDFEDNKTVEVNQTPNIVDATVAPEPTDITDETPNIYKKCRLAAILSDGCKWTDKTETSFNLKILSSSKVTIPGVWFFITGESGTLKTVKREESILSGGSRTFRVDYAALVKEIGRVTRFEVLPIEIINDTEVACFNQHVYTIPDTYCRPSEPVKVD